MCMYLGSPVQAKIVFRVPARKKTGNHAVECLALLNVGIASSELFVYTYHGFLQSSSGDSQGGSVSCVTEEGWSWPRRLALEIQQLIHLQILNGGMCIVICSTTVHCKLNKRSYKEIYTLLGLTAIKAARTDT